MEPQDMFQSRNRVSSNFNKTNLPSTYSVNFKFQSRNRVSSNFNTEIQPRGGFFTRVSIS